MIRYPYGKTAAKYGNKKIHTPEGDFDSKHEFERFCELSILSTAGAIRNLDRQVRFPLFPPQKGEFRAERGTDYIADSSTRKSAATNG